MTSNNVFEDIRIVGMDDQKTYNPDPSKVLYDIYLELSTTPSREWQQIFDSEWHFPKHSMWRKAWAQGKYIIIHAPLDEIEKHHIQYLKEAVEKANTEYRHYLEKRQQQETKALEAKEKERQDIRSLKDRLKFD